MLVFRIGGTRCTLTFGFAAAVCAVFIFGENGAAGTVLGCILWHELGHLVALRFFHTPPECLRMTFFGLELAVPAQRSYRREAAVSLGGPAANLLAAALLWCAPFRRAAGLHLLLGLFHLLPVLPMDGGQALQSLLCLWLSPRQAGRVAVGVSAAVLLPLGTLGFWLLLQTSPNITLLALCLYLLFYLVFGIRE